MGTPDLIAPDFRGRGDSSLAPDDFYDIAAFSIDCYTLVHDVLGRGDVRTPALGRARPSRQASFDSRKAVANSGSIAL